MDLASRAVTRALLLSPRTVAANLARAERAGVVPRAPTPFQVALGVLRMWHRVLFRSDTIGTCRHHPVRSSWRARLLEHRPIRFPFLLAEKAVAPWDFSGLLSSPERIIAHLLGAHHDAQQFVYDLEILRCHPGALERLHARTQQLIARDDARSRWLRDLVVYERYHENLLAAVERALHGEDALGDADGADPDISFAAYLRWCARQPPTLAAAWHAWRRGRLSLSSHPEAA